MVPYLAYAPRTPRPSAISLLILSSRAAISSAFVSTSDVYKRQALDNDTHEIIGESVVMTTHDHEMGVAAVSYTHLVSTTFFTV